MIVSASRRTDIPAYYMEWFLARLQAEEALVRNPVNPRMVSRVPLNRKQVDGIVFWSKNPSGLLAHLEELRDWPWYLQFTLTGYGRDVEPGLPDKKGKLIPLFQTLARRAGAERLVWRYDPIYLGGAYTAEYHERAFRAIAGQLSGCTDQVVISFLDLYGKTRRNMKGMAFRPLEEAEMRDLAREMAAIAGEHGMRIAACAEELDFSAQGLEAGACIDPERLGRLCGYPLRFRKDRAQRPACGCAASVDVGAYDTCPGGCRYCYANDSAAAVEERRKAYRLDSPLLCSALGERDTVRERKR